MIRQHQVDPNPGWFAGRSRGQKLGIGCGGAWLALLVLPIVLILLGFHSPTLILVLLLAVLLILSPLNTVFTFLGYLSPLLIPALIVLLVLAVRRPATVRSITGLGPFRHLPMPMISEPVRFAATLAVVLIPLSMVAGAIVYGILPRALH